MITTRHIAILEVNRTENWAYLAVHSVDPNEHHCFNDSIPLNKLESLLGYELQDGDHRPYTEVDVDADGYWKARHVQ